MSSRFHIELAKEEDIPQLAALITPTFADVPLEILLGNIDTPGAVAASSQRHLQAWREHLTETGISSAIKCLHTDPQSGEETLAACAGWYIFDQPRSAENARNWNFLLSGEWLPEDDGQRAKANDGFRPMAEARIKWTAGRAHGLCQYLCTEERFRRQGAASLVIQWGIDRCRELGIPAYLEAGDLTKPFYEKFGFQQVETVYTKVDGVKSSFPTMMWWPPGTKEEDKRPLST